MPISKALKNHPRAGFSKPWDLAWLSLVSVTSAGGWSHSKLTDREMQASVLCREQSHISRSIQHGVQCPFPALQSSPSVLPGAEPRTQHTTQPHGASCFQLAHNLGMARTIRSSCLFLAHLMKQMRGEQRTHGKAGNQGITATQQVAGIRENLMHPGAWAHPSHLNRSL